MPKFRKINIFFQENVCTDEWMDGQTVPILHNPSD